MLRADGVIEILHLASHQLGVGMRSHFLNHVVLLPSADDHADVRALSVLRTELLQLMARELARKDAEQMHHTARRMLDLSLFLILHGGTEAEHLLLAHNRLTRQHRSQHQLDICPVGEDNKECRHQKD